MTESVSFDLEQIFKCRACKDKKLGFAERFTFAPKNDCCQKYPPIERGRALFFVSTNPRQSKTNVDVLNWAMDNLENFPELSGNRYQRNNLHAHRGVLQYLPPHL
jgi:hypothetical protein